MREGDAMSVGQRMNVTSSWTSMTVGCREGGRRCNERSCRHVHAFPAVCWLTSNNDIGTRQTSVLEARDASFWRGRTILYKLGRCRMTGRVEEVMACRIQNYGVCSGTSYVAGCTAHPSPLKMRMARGVSHAPFQGDSLR